MRIPTAMGPAIGRCRKMFAEARGAMNLKGIRTMVAASLAMFLISAPVLPANAAPAGGTRTVGVTDPIFNMRAYSYTVPDGWLFDGAAIPGTTCGGGIVPVFRAIRPDGLVGIKSLPRMDWAWSNNPTLAKKDEQPDCL